MACFKHGTIIDLAARESVSLPDMRGTTLRITRGSVWITQENDTKDIVLHAGDNWVVEKNGLTILEAQEDTTFCALGRQLDTGSSPRPAAHRVPSRFATRVRDAFASFFRPRRAIRSRMCDALCVGLKPDPQGESRSSIASGKRFRRAEIASA